MIEYPESHVLASQINKELKGKTVEGAVFNSSPHKFTFYFKDVRTYPDLLVGKTIEGADGFGGNVEVSLGEVKMAFNDGVNFKYHEKAENAGSKHQMLLTFDDGSALVCTVQMYGGIGAFYEGENKNKYYLGNKEKPDILSDAFSLDYFRGLYDDAMGEKKKFSVKAFLATLQRIPGLGNGVLQDILFNAGLHPKTSISGFSQEEIDSLYRCVTDTIRSMTEHGGRDVEKDFYGNPGGYKTILSNKTYQYPCAVCGSAIVRQAYLGGNVYFCPKCQPL